MGRRRFRCFTCRRGSESERDHVGHRCNSVRAWVVLQWRLIKAALGLWDWGPTEVLTTHIQPEPIDLTYEQILANVENSQSPIPACCGRLSSAYRCDRDSRGHRHRGGCAPGCQHEART